MASRELLQQALDALENSYLSDEHRNYELQAKAIAALREALNAPEPEPVARCILDNGDEMGSVEWLVRPRSIRLDHGSLLYAAPPAAPADDLATPSGGQEAGPQEDRIEAAYWRFDARHKGYSQWKTAPMSERDAFKAEMRNALEAEKVRAEMRLVARGWLRPDTPAAPDHLHDIAEKVAPAAPVVREPLTIDQEKALSAEAKTGPFQHTTPVVGNDMQSGETLRLSSKRHAGSTPPAAPIPDGMVMVPREPTEEMIQAAAGAWGESESGLHNAFAAALRGGIAASPVAPVVPIDMVLHCPACGLQHIDAPDERTPDWKNEPHRSHLCHGCGHIWRPADVPTNGVAAVATKGKADSPITAPVAPLTDEQLAKIAVEDEFLLYCDQDSFNEIARAIEAAHGITGASK